MRDTFYGLGLQYDSGSTPSVAVNAVGVVLEVHKNEAGFALYYRVGQVNASSIDWSPSTQYDSGVTPSVALSMSGVIVEVHKNEAGYTLYMSIGTTTGSGPISLGPAKAYDHGITPSVAVNDLGVIFEVHKTQSPFSNSLYYVVGKINLASREVDWARGVAYATGSFPRVALNAHNVVVAVHQAPDEEVLYYCAGNANQPKPFGPSVRFDRGSAPAVALTDDGFVVVTFQRGSTLWQRCGRVNGQTIEWNGEAVQYDRGVHTSVAAAGNFSVEVHEGELLKSLWCAPSLITDRASWMQDRVARLGNRRLAELVLPASHDAGMYTGGLSTVAQTQDLPIGGQLRAGIRYFDLRLKWTGSKFVIAHAFIPGPDLTEVLDDITAFALESIQELVILKFSHFDNIDEKIYPKLVHEIQTRLGPWLVTSTPDGKRLADVTLEEFVQRGPALLVVVDGSYAVNYPVPGFWVYRDWESGSPERGDLRVYDIYSNVIVFDEMKKDQFAKFAAYDGRMKQNPKLPCDLFLLSWTLTPVTAVWLVSAEANRRLGENMVAATIPNAFGQIINLLYVDYVEYARVTDVALFLNGEQPFVQEAGQQGS
jgi:hypothetical protein